MAFQFFKKKELQLVAPLSGTVVPLEKVPDPVFSQKMMGDGVAIEPSGSHIYAPVSGEIILVAPTKHAIAIRSKNGDEILIHIGLETVSLKGTGFQVAVKEGDQVKVGQLLIEVDWSYLENHVESTVTPIIVTKSDKDVTYGDAGLCTQGETIIMTI